MIYSCLLYTSDAADARNVSRVMRSSHRSDEVLAAESDHAVYTVSNAITSLLDSGAEICCLNADIAKDRSNSVAPILWKFDYSRFSACHCFELFRCECRL